MLKSIKKKSRVLSIILNFCTIVGVIVVGLFTLRVAMSILFSKIVWLAIICIFIGKNYGHKKTKTKKARDIK